ncbi:hypothetical protein AJ80_09465 [Polytolypa hystricis UAMH7299]|uniref:Meiotic sister chromatid recombination protein Ish1/Msc1 n=1 Tax=Polytolypa hystricis (strain UAMH7299) TaxID=1447883 RepID=A0A2B7WQH0_POLH7|nr:hypothetical protein AJ80_09465 [Polytolypa hystricis UAMH7299]
MRFSLITGFVLFLATTEVVASKSWFSKAVYNKWHENELERWLSDHDIPYPSPADRKDLEDLVKPNWESAVKVPVTQSAEYATDKLHSTKDWIFDSWSDSQLKAFLDRHGIPNPQPKKRDTLLSAVRENYEAIAQKLGQTTLYPGNWLYAHWSESDLKEWLDSHGFAVPQPTTRDKLVAHVRRNARLASLQAQRASASTSSSIATAQESLSEALFNAWSESDFKKFFDEHGIKVPQGSNRNEMVALARRHRALLLEKPASSITSAYGAATSKAGNEFARATEDAELRREDLFNAAIQKWSDSRLKAFLDARGIPVPQSSTRDELLAQVRLNKYKATTGFSAWTFDTWTKENLGKYLSFQHKKALKDVDYTRDELVKQAQSAYAKASKSGGTNYASVTSYLTQATGAAKDKTFDTWSQADLKKYLESFGIKSDREKELEQLRAEATHHANYFRYGILQQEATIFDRLQNGVQWVYDQLKIGALGGRSEGQKAAEAAKAKASKAKGHAEL